MYRYLFLILFSLIIDNSIAQNKELLAVVEYELAGEWKGKLTQGGSNKIAPSYDFELHLMVDGNTISGHSYIRANGNYAKIKLKGVKKDLGIEITEIKITSSSIKKDYFWCIKNLHLEFGFENGRYRLKGAWDGTNGDRSCSPGNIIVYKETIRA